MSSNSAKKGANKARSAEQAKLDQQQAQFDQQQQNMQPWLDAGKGALDRLNLASTGDMSNFYNSPDYQFTLDQGIKTVNRGQVGNLFGGGQSADLLRLGQGLASQQYGDWWNRQAGLAQVGQTQSQAMGNLGQNFSQMYGQGMSNIGNINQSAVENQGNIWGNVVGQLSGLFGQYQGQKQQSAQAPTWNYGGGQGSMYNFGNNVGNFMNWSG